MSEETLEPHYPPNCMLQGCGICAKYSERFDHPKPHQEMLSACGCTMETIGNGHFKCIIKGASCNKDIHVVGAEV